MFKRKNLAFLTASIFLLSMFTVLTASNAVAAGNSRAAAYVYFITPTDGETVSGTIDIQIATNRRPYLYLDGVYAGKGSSFTWDTTGATRAHGNGFGDCGTKKPYRTDGNKLPGSDRLLRRFLRRAC